MAATPPKAQFNKFILDEVFPDPLDTLHHLEPSLTNLCADCVYVFDTNALLDLFQFGKAQLEIVANIYRQLAKNNRLFVPKRALQEFAKNRPTVLKGVFDATLKAK